MDLPFLFKSGAEASLAMWDLYRKRKTEIAGRSEGADRFHLCDGQHNGSEAGSNLADLQDLKLRAAGTGVDIMKALGAAPEGMPMSQVPESLQKGVVQGLVSSLEVLKDMKFGRGLQVCHIHRPVGGAVCGSYEQEEMGCLYPRM